MFPTDDAAHRERVLHALRGMARDNVEARWPGADGVYRRRERPEGEPPYRVQQDSRPRRSAPSRGLASAPAASYNPSSALRITDSRARFSRAGTR
jgi:hypothetical protein